MRDITVPAQRPSTVRSGMSKTGCVDAATSFRKPCPASSTAGEAGHSCVTERQQQLLACGNLRHGLSRKRILVIIIKKSVVIGEIKRRRKRGKDYTQRRL